MQATPFEKAFVNEDSKPFATILAETTPKHHSFDFDTAERLSNKQKHATLLAFKFLLPADN